MIRRARLKFFCVTASIILIMLAAICFVILFSTHLSNEDKANSILNTVLEDLDSPFPPLQSKFDEMRSFAAYIDHNGNPIAYTTSTYFTTEEIEAYIDAILKTGKSKGDIGDIRFLFKEGALFNIIAITDFSLENDAFSKLLGTVILSASIAAIVLLILTWVLSYWIVRPVVTSIDKQKRFISEAGHELKTPLTIISAGVDLLRKQLEDNNIEQSLKWTQAIEQQTERLSLLTNELLHLAKLDENAQKPMTSEFNLSQAVLTEALSFESVAFEKGKALLIEIQPSLTLNGNQQAIKDMVVILCDNAIKHSPRASTINILLKRQGTKTILRVSNPCPHLNKTELPLLFDRFYRGSDSRATHEGSGLGLSILKRLCDNNNHKLQSTLDNNTLTFTILL